MNRKNAILNVMAALGLLVTATPLASAGISDDVALAGAGDAVDVELYNILCWSLGTTGSIRTCYLPVYVGVCWKAALNGYVHFC